MPQLWKMEVCFGSIEACLNINKTVIVAHQSSRQRISLHYLELDLCHILASFSSAEMEWNG